MTLTPKWQRNQIRFRTFVKRWEFYLSKISYPSYLTKVLLREQPCDQLWPELWNQRLKMTWRQRRDISTALNHAWLALKCGCVWKFTVHLRWFQELERLRLVLFADGLDLFLKSGKNGLEEIYLQRCGLVPNQILFKKIMAIVRAQIRAIEQ